MEPVPTIEKRKEIRTWAESALSKLGPLSLNDRQLWMATAPRGEKHFNYRRASYACRTFPEYRPRFEALGVVVR